MKGINNGLSMFIMLILLSLSRENRIVNGTIRDAFTGRRVSAKIRVYKGNEFLKSFKSNGNFSLSLSKGEHFLYVESEGYEPLRFKLRPSLKESLRITIYLTPKEYDTIFPQFETQRIIKGYVSDENGVMLRNVKIEIKSRGIFTMTDSNGVFILKTPKHRREITHKNIPKDTIFITLKGYKTVIKEILDIPENVVLKIILKKGQGKIFKKEVKSPGTGECGTKPIPFKDKRSRFRQNNSKRNVLETPSSIRVGTNCSGTNCSDVSVMSISAYVSTGLDDEWIASWHSQSLRAGAVAYRSYGVWYVDNPISNDYDICSNIFCQVWDGSDTYQSVVEAASKTTGVLLERNNYYARSEYSAENNDCGCGDGYAGDGLYWPCVEDSICAGHSCFGHGRGMCQWGTSRWADSGMTWKWMVEHYYGPGNMDIASPIRIDSVSWDTGSISPGDSFILSYHVRSFAKSQLSNILLGASLYNSSYGFYSDTLNDVKCIVLPDTISTLQRIFKVDSALPVGVYDLYMALWMDVDDDEKITASDLPLYLIEIEDAITISTVKIRESTYQSSFSWAYEENTLGNFNFGYYLPEDSYIKIYLYDELGRVVKKYFEGEVKKGINAIKVNSKELKKGVYFLVVNRNNAERLVRKIIIVP